ncbi:MAG: class I SAM-dependent methyltransferase [Paraburkholderia sp.]|uniref:class I SAM-dependent methyltransferase n=1 Tax=Paraburkholderia sp. TaxID=1926495 RepID=UPI00120D65F5|nr:class I SAM-dependent methyltransferase [Paraburkholderia sp.]TAM05438.1 MAG: class I SAM-dependent methyltransferase [Paraburkholderia sp.]TAM27870.1 MAG: class I SAM-dependent methyltransferase [Paraburkholderia sp.]
MSDRTIIDWPAWTASPAGKYVLDWEQEQLDRVVSNIFGYHALQLGMPQLDALRENRMSCRGLVLDGASAASAPYTAPSAHADGNSGAIQPRHAPVGRSTVWCDLLDLPFEAQSVDLIVMPHALEFTSDPHRLLREAERVLMPEGQLVIVGFNSLSLWGARQSVGKLAGQPFLPARQDLIAFTRLKDWIKLLGFELERGRFGCYRPPLATDKWLARYAFMEAAGDRWWPIFGAVYMVTAIKRVRGMHLVGPLKVKKPVLAPSLKAATTTPSPTRNKET